MAHMNMFRPRVDTPTSIRLSMLSVAFACGANTSVVGYLCQQLEASLTRELLPQHAFPGSFRHLTVERALGRISSDYRRNFGIGTGMWWMPPVRYLEGVRVGEGGPRKVLQEAFPM